MKMSSNELDAGGEVEYASSHHGAAVVSRGWVKASACCLHVTLYWVALCQIVSLHYVSRSPLHRLASLPCRMLLSYGLQVVTREVYRSYLTRLMSGAQDHFIFSYTADYIYHFCSLPEPRCWYCCHCIM